MSNGITATNYPIIAAEAQEFLRSIETPSERHGVRGEHRGGAIHRWTGGLEAGEFLRLAGVAHIVASLREQAPNDDLFGSTASVLNVPHPPIDYKEMTDDQKKSLGNGGGIYYTFEQTSFGEVLVASSPVGICHLDFCDVSREQAAAALRLRFPAAVAAYEGSAELHEHAAAALSMGVPYRTTLPLPLHISGTEFQHKVWRHLATLAVGQLTTYGAIARRLGYGAGTSRAVGTAVGDNPIAVLIPCHRAMAADGVIREYRWGSIRKTILTAWEQHIIRR